jgi:hypothetical protein
MPDSKIKDQETVSVQTVTEATPAEADKTSAPVPNDAKLNDPPVRTNRPDVPIAQTLIAGAGAHAGRDLDHEVDGEPVDANGIDAGGRFLGEPSKSKK